MAGQIQQTVLPQAHIVTSAIVSLEHGINNNIIIIVYLSIELHN